MIQYLSGDILLSQAQGIAHGIAPNDDFKQGLALSLREQWPAMYKDFRHFCQSTHPKEGTLWTWKGAGGPHIINLFTQEHPPAKGATPGKAKLKYVSRCLQELVTEIQNLKLESLALPRIATGVGGLDWIDVKPLIETHLGQLKIPIFVYEKYQKQLKAIEAQA